MDVKFLSIADFKEQAEKKISKAAWDYFNCGVGEGISVRESEEAFQRWYLRPRVMRDVSNTDISTEIYGRKIDFPVGIAPTAFHKMAHSDGEIATAKGAEKMNCIYVQSLFSTVSVEDVSAAAPKGYRWIHSQLLNDRRVTRDLMLRAAKAGCEAIVITVDQPCRGAKIANLRNGFKVPKSFKYANFPTKNTTKSQSSRNFVSLMDSTVTWTDIRYLRNYTNLKIIVKGILTGDMATEAIEYGGVDGIIVSSHGGRQLEGAVPPIEALRDVVTAVGGRCDVFVDGGIRSGNDILKALALGAKAVFIGRPILWGLICAGEEGVRRVLELLKNEFLIAMQLMGMRSVEELRSAKGLLMRRGCELPSKL